MQDEVIVELYWQRNETAIAETEKKYSAYLTKISMNILSDRMDSEESVNDTYLAAWNSIPPQKPKILSAYLSKLTRRISIDKFRKRTRDKRKASEYALSLDEVSNIIGHNETPEEQAEAEYLGKLIGEFLRTLREEEKNAFIGRYYYLDSLRDVASYLGIGEGKAKSMLFRTRNKLKLFLEKGGYTT